MRSTSPEIKRRVIGRSLPIHQLKIGIRFEDGFAEVIHSIPASISGDPIHIAGGIGRGSVTGLPDSSAVVVRNRVEEGRLGEVAGIVGEGKALVGSLVAVGSKGEIDVAVRKEQTGTLKGGG